MATPTIIIGIGTSGLYTLENIQRFYYESFQVNKPDHVEYIYLETNKDNFPGVTPLPNQIKRVYLSLAQMEEMIEDIKTYTKADWLPPAEQLVDAGLGAGGIRSVGRLSLWGRNNEGDNFENFIQALNSAYANVSNFTHQNVEASKPVVFVTGTLTGGTGSGICIDIGYLIRHLIPDIRELFGLFLLPPNPKVIRGNEVRYANAYGAIKDIDTYNSTENMYSEKWPSGYECKSNKAPYEIVQYISQDYNDGSPALKNLQGLYKMAGLYLFLNITGVREKRMERLVDAKGNSLIGKIGTFGLSGIQFPKDLIQEYVALNLSEDLISRWIDSVNYVEFNHKKPINRGLVLGKMIDEWTIIIKKAFEMLNTVSDRDLISEIEKEAIKINKKDIQGDPDVYLKNLFTHTVGDNFYALVKNNLQVAVNFIIERLHDIFIDTLNQTENLYYTKELLNAIDNAIERNISYWREKEIAAETEPWENLLRDQINWMLSFRYGFLMEQDAVLADRMISTFEMMKMHLFVGKLNEIRNYMSREDSSYKSTTNSNKEVPKTSLLDKYIRYLGETLGEIDPEKQNVMTIKQRKRELLGDLSDDTIPILRIFRTGSFESETENSKAVYLQKTNNAIPTKESILEKVDLWTYLRSIAYNFHNELYSKCLRSYREKIGQYGCVEDFDVSKYVEQNPKDGVKMARKSLNSFIMLSKFLTPNASLPRFIVGSDKNALRNVVKQFNENSFTDFSDSKDGLLELQELKNILVFYDEKGNYNPLTDLKYIEQMKAVFEHKPAGYDELTEEKWKNFRTAYKIKKADKAVANPPEKTEEAVDKSENENT